MKCPQKIKTKPWQVDVMIKERQWNKNVDGFLFRSAFETSFSVFKKYI